MIRASWTASPRARQILTRTCPCGRAYNCGARESEAQFLARLRCPTCASSRITPQERATLNQMRADGAGLLAMAGAIHRSTASVQSWLDRQRPDSRPTSAPRTRPCLCCGRVFASEGPHNRICDPCKRTAPFDGPAL